MKFSSSITLAAVASSASAHTIFVSLNDNAVGDGVRVPSYDGPITDVTTDDIVCNGGPNPTTPTSTVIDVQAGSEVTLTWRHTLTSGPEDVIDSSHKGPVMAYMKKVSDAKSDSGIGAGWFKISSESYDAGTQKWGVDNLIANGGVQTVTIPKCIAPGQYLLRGELIALHSASSPNGAQFYMECAQINVLGGEASKTPSDTVSLPGAYKQDEPGILFNLYSGQIDYQEPGPGVFTC
jgi:cellulase